MRPQSTLCAFDPAPDAISVPSETLGAMLALHLAQPGGAFTSILMQIGPRQQAYVRLGGCGQCHTGVCAIGCRVDLFGRILAAELPQSRLRVVGGSLAIRPYTRGYVAVPRHDALPLSGALLHPWPDRSEERR